MTMRVDVIPDVAAVIGVFIVVAHNRSPRCNRQNDADRQLERLIDNDRSDHRQRCRFPLPLQKQPDTHCAEQKRDQHVVDRL
jgi:hypothetical protein